MTLICIHVKLCVREVVCFALKCSERDFLKLKIAMLDRPDHNLNMLFARGVFFNSISFVKHLSLNFISAFSNEQNLFER